MRSFAEQHRSATIVIGMAIASTLMIVLPKVPPLSLVQNESPWFDAFANAGVYVLLAMGLNVVIGLAGLLDLGYAAFFAIGSYVYAYSNSPYSGLDLPFLPYACSSAPRSRPSSASPSERRRCGCGATTWRS